MWLCVQKWNHVKADDKCGSTGLQYTIQNYDLVKDDQTIHDSKLNQLSN